MLAYVSTFKNEIATWRLRQRNRMVPVIAVVAALAGCEGFPDLDRELRETFTSGKEVEVEGPGPGYRATEESDVIITLDRAAVKRLQAQLAELGFEPGPVDGVVGSQTTEAIKRYQSAHSLPTTGKISSRFLQHLETTSASQDANARLPVNLGSEDLPSYQLGTTFVYSNGEVDRVLSLEGTAVNWIRSDGTTYTAHRNFLLPWSNWASNKQRGTAKISEAADALWPLRKGTEVAFLANTTVQRRDNPDSTERRVDRWYCRNDGRRDITVGAGTFETLVFVCRRGSQPGFPEVVRTWYYAKDVRHYVRFVESDLERQTTREVDLVAVRPGAPDWPPIVRDALARAVVHALETPETESQMLWTSSGVNTRVTIEAKSRFVARSGRPCRQFKQIWSENGRHRHYPALACKTTAGTWQIPGLKSNKMDLLVISGEMS